MIEGPRGKHPEIVNVARFVSLIAGADFFGDDFSERQARQIGRRKRQELEITLLNLRPPLRRQRRRLSPADLQLDFAFALVPVVRVSRIDAP